MKIPVIKSLIISGCALGTAPIALADYPAINSQWNEVKCVSHDRDARLAQATDSLLIRKKDGAVDESALESLLFDDDQADTPRKLRRYIKKIVAVNDREKRTIDLFSGVVDPTSAPDDRSAESDEVERLQALLAQKRQLITQLTVRLSRKDDDLNQAISTLNALQGDGNEKTAMIAENGLEPVSYMAGEMMASELKDRINAWSQVGVSIRHKSFMRGLTDGLKKHLRLRRALADKSLSTFMQKVQEGTALKFQQANQQIDRLIGSRKPLLTRNGIVWFRVKEGRPVSTGQSIVISMSERIVGGKVISKVPPIALRADDEMPVIIRDGMTLPGKGGEVVAYALAGTVYGHRPLPKMVQPFTVMEYRLKGEN